MSNQNEESPAPVSIDTTKSYSIATYPTSTSTTSTTTTPSTTTTTLSTTESTTTSTTTAQRSTTSVTTTKRYSLWKNSDDVPKTPKTYFSNSFYQNNNNNKNPNNINGPTYKTVTKRPSSDYDNDSDISSIKPAPTTPTINPFYYGFNRLPRYSTTSRYTQQPNNNTKLSSNPTSPSTTNIIINTTTTKSSTLINNNKITRTPYQNHHYYFTSTKKPDLLAATNFEVDDNSYHEIDDNIETEKPTKSSTYNPVFDIYFKQIARQKTAVPRIR